MANKSSNINKKTNFNVNGYLTTTKSFKTNDKKFKESLQKISSEHQMLTRQEFNFPYNNELTFFKTEVPLATYDEKGEPTTIEKLLQTNVSVRGVIFQYDFMSKEGQRITGITIKVKEIKQLPSNVKI